MITQFGPGALFGTRTDATASPCNFGQVDSFTLDVARTVKPIYGGQQAPIDFGGGQLKISGKAKMAAFSSLAFASLFYGVAPATGSQVTQYKEAAVVPSATPWTVTVANGATYVATREVLYAGTGLPLQQVASNPTAGQYSVAAGGIYTFETSDAGKALLITYDYTLTTGNQLVVNNQLQGSIPTFEMAFYAVKNGKTVCWQFPFCVAEKLNRDAKDNDFNSPEIDILVGANAAGLIITENYPELS